MPLAFDVGGTFTDVVFVDGAGVLRTAKLLSLLDRVGADIRGLLRDAGGTPAAAGFVHATTIASNAVIEGTLATVGVITTAGFRDTLDMRGQRRPPVYDVTWERLPPVTRRALCVEVAERVLSDGTVDRPLDEEDVGRAIDRLLASRVEAIAVSLINAYVTPVHERQIGALLGRRAPDVPASLSSDRFAEIGEYERTSTTAVNAGLLPIVDRYLSRLEEQLGVGRGGVLVMQSAGGLMSSETARRWPVQMIESGPAAGVLAAARLAADLGLPDVIAFDMGGTTAKASTIAGGRPVEKPQSEVGGGSSLATRLFGGGGHVVRVPSLDIVEVGAGGGSIAWIDAAGALRVGPRGAGAAPGPACYGRGGTEPTVTDANLVLGYLNPRSLAAGSVELHPDAAFAAVARLASRLGLGVLDAAHGVRSVANATMIRALRAVTVERGVDPRRMTLVAYGGSGPLHAAALAEALGIGRIVVPRLPGVFSAAGLLLAGHRHDAARGAMLPLSSLDLAACSAILAELRAEAVAELAREGPPAADPAVVESVDLQYRGEQASLRVDLPSAASTRQLRGRLAAAFRARYRETYGFDRADDVWVAAFRVRAVTPAGVARLADLPAALDALDGRPAPRPRDAYFGRALGTLPAAVVARSDVTGELAGPVIVEEADSTTLVPPGWSVAPAVGGHLVLGRPAEAGG